MGEAMDLGTCKAKKKNGEPCTQIVNLVGLKSVSLGFAYGFGSVTRGCTGEQTGALGERAAPPPADHVLTGCSSPTA